MYAIAHTDVLGVFHDHHCSGVTLRFGLLLQSAVPTRNTGT